MMNLRDAAFAAVASTCLFLTGPVAAHDRDEVRISISSDDLDLRSAAGLARLDGRIRVAIERACASDAPGLAGTQDTARCRADMRASASPQLAALRDRASRVRVAAR